MEFWMTVGIFALIFILAWSAFRNPWTGILVLVVIMIIWYAGLGGWILGWAKYGFGQVPTAPTPTPIAAPAPGQPAPPAPAPTQGAAPAPKTSAPPSGESSSTPWVIDPTTKTMTWTRQSNLIAQTGEALKAIRSGYKAVFTTTEPTLMEVCVGTVDGVRIADDCDPRDHPLPAGQHTYQAAPNDKAGFRTKKQ